MSADERVLERVAKAAFTATTALLTAEKGHSVPLPSWDEETEYLRLHWRVFAAAAMAELKALGLLKSQGDT